MGRYILLAVLFVSGLSAAIAAAPQTQAELDRTIQDATRILDSDKIATQFRPVALRQRAYALNESGRPQEALRDADEILKIEPGEFAGLVLRGWALNGLRRWQDATVDLTAALKLNPSNDFALAQRIRAWRALGRFDEAMADANTLIRVDAHNPASYVERAYVYYDKQDWDRAIADCTAALNLNPKFEIAYERRGLAHLANMEFDEALADYDRAVPLGPPSSALLASRGSLHEVMGDFAGAMADYTAAARADPQNEEPVGLRGRLRAIQGDFRGAIPDLDQARKLDPQDGFNFLWLHIARRRAGIDDRESFVKEAASFDPKRWPGPAIGYFLGAVNADDVIQASLHDPRTAHFHQRCDGWFYVAEDALIKGDRETARPLLEKTVMHCNAVDYEWDAAQLELKRLGR